MWIQRWKDGNPPEHVWLGVSVEDQKRAIQRRKAFNQVPAEIKFVSYEPALSDVDWKGWDFIDWLIFGGESGDNRRPCDLAWEQHAREWCAANKIAYFCKQDSDRYPGMRGRIAPEVFAIKQFPNTL